jgi:acetolactate synthase-1/2/3 large subunit
VVILADNAGWMAIKDLQIDVLGAGSAFGNDFERGGKSYSPDFVKIAEAFGIRAEKISSPKGCKAAFERAIGSGKPYLIHVDVCRDYPYSGGKAFGWWDVPIPAYDTERRNAYEVNKSEETI